MSTLETTISAPLTQWDDGTVRITGSRVPIDSVIYHFKLGATAEEIGYKFPSLRLADIYGAIYFCELSVITPILNFRDSLVNQGCR